MYPNLEDSLNGEKPHADARKTAPINCREIFTQGTRGFLKKVRPSELTPKRSFVCGYQVPTKQLWVFAGLSLLFFSSFTGTILMWFTNTFDNTVLSYLSLSKNHPTYDLWRKPPVRIITRVHIFNYTNVRDYEMGSAEKLHVDDLGPYTYEQTMERVNVVHNGDGTVSYQEKRDYKFLPELSVGRRQSDRLVVPNLPMLGAASVSRDSYYITRLSMSGLLKTLNAKPFLSLPAHRFIFGYDDPLFDLAKGVLSFKHDLPFDKFGVLASKYGLSRDVITISTGENGMNDFGYVQNVNGHTDIGHWSTVECNSIAGTDGTVFPPHLVREKRPLSVYQKDTCRRFPLVFAGETKILNGKIPAYKYSLPVSVFDHPDLCPEHQCYCNMDSGDCPPQGVFNSTPCSFGAPAFLSFPHFFSADEDTVQSVDGLRPRAEYGDSYLYVHPRYGMAMAGSTKMQMNVQVRKSFGMTQLEFFDDDLMLPVAWVELEVRDVDLPEVLTDLVYLATFTVVHVELGLKYGCFLTAAVTLVCMGMLVWGRWRSRGRFVA